MASSAKASPKGAKSFVSEHVAKIDVVANRKDRSYLHMASYRFAWVPLSPALFALPRSSWSEPFQRCHAQ
ncbi:hypothetical protein [Pseudomonas sp. Marseille-Q5115]|uniref:hypothetical protein n=1 Tax=Pseudomonas sp. Marseille-Q5115 TaxID=2866593 RepID=UPI001CE4B592|nr:hypothetical protein [Pseudomonas sp. Marseille-Q5115]